MSCGSAQSSLPRGKNGGKVRRGVNCKHTHAHTRKLDTGVCAEKQQNRQTVSFMLAHCPTVAYGRQWPVTARISTPSDWDAAQSHWVCTNIKAYHLVLTSFTPLLDVKPFIV